MVVWVSDYMEIWVRKERAIFNRLTEPGLIW